MADPFKYTLTFENVNVGNGANEAAAGVAKVAGEVQKLQGREADLRSEFSGVTDKFDATRVASYNLSEELKKSSVSSGKFSDSQVTVAKSSRNSSLALLELSRGFEDAQYGIRGVLNNIPSLVLSLGGTAGLAGAISLGAVAFSQIYSWMTRTEEKTSDVTDEVKLFVDAVGQMQAGKFEDAAAAIDAAAERTAALTQNWTETNRAEEAFSTAAISNAEKLAQAQALIAEALGLQVDRFRELEAIAARQAEARRVAAEQEISAEQRRLQLAQNAVKETENALLVGIQNREAKKAELDSEREKLLALRAQRDELEKIARQKFGIEAILPENGGGFNLPGSPTPQAERAQGTLQSAEFQKNIQGVQESVKQLEIALDSITRDGGGIQTLENKAISAAKVLEDTNAAVSQRIEQITQTLQADDLLARSQNLVDQGEALATGLQQTLGKVTATSAAAVQTKANLETLASDGQITADESVKLGENLRQLIGQVQAGLASYSGPVSELIQLQDRGNALVNTLIGQVGALRDKQAVLEKRIGALQFR